MMMLPILMLTLASAHGSMPELKPTRVRWCQSLLELHDRAPASQDDLMNAVTEAEGRAIDEITRIDSRRTEMPTLAELDLSEPHLKPVRANLRHRTEAEFERQLRSSKGRLARLARDLKHPVADGHTIGRIDVGADDIRAFLDDLPRGAANRQRASGEGDQVRPIDPRYALRALGTLGGLGAVAGGSAVGASLINDETHRQPVFLGAVAAFSLWHFGWSVAEYGAEFKSPAARIRLENLYDQNRVDVEPEAASLLKALVASPPTGRRLFAHHGYAVYVSEETLTELVRRDPNVTPAARRGLSFAREPFAVFVDHVLFHDENDQLTLLSTKRVLPTSELPREFLHLSRAGEF